MSPSEVNKIIKSCTSYGIRHETVKRTGYKLSFSNAQCCWYRRSGAYKSGKELVLDANEIFVEGSARDIDSILEHLETLPLYANSFEARFR